MQRNQKRVYLDLGHAFGSNCSGGFKDCVAIFQQDKNQTKIVFPVGKCIAKKFLDRNQMQFIKLSENLQSIECLCISPQKTHIAVCQKLKNQNILIMALYSIKNADSQKKVFRYVPNAEMKATTFKAFAFSPSQQKFMCCLTGEPDYQLIFIDNSRMRGLAFSNFSLKDVNRIAISPNQSHLISVSGKNFFRLYKVEQYAFKPLQQVKRLPKNRNFTQHAWTQKTKILLGTDRGQIFLIGPIGNNYEVKRQFLTAFNEGSNQLSVTAICPFSKGFILGSDKGKFSLWVKKQDNQQNYEDQDTVDLVRRWQTNPERQSQVTCIDISAKQDLIVISFKNNDVATIDMNQILPQTLESVEAFKKSKEKEIYFDYMFRGFHNAPITAMDVCLQRPLIATCSKMDNTIRIWNYKNPRCQLLRMFSYKNKQSGMDQKNINPLITLAFHPAGYYLAVGCIDKLRLYHVLNTQLRSYKEIVIKGVCQLKFSNGGHYLAAAYPKQKYNIHHINIYNAYTLQEVAHLNQHNNVITQLQWGKNDQFLLSSGIDGAIIQWRTSDWVAKKFIQNNSKYTSVMYNYENNTLLSSGIELSKNIVRQIKIDKEREVYQKVHHMGFKVVKLKWLVSQWNFPAILAGTDEGSVKIFNINFDNLAQQTINAHSKDIVKIQTSPCGRYVFTVGQDGVLFIYHVSITNKDGTVIRRKLNEAKQLEQAQLNPYVAVVDDFLADIVLVNRNDIDEHIKLQKHLKMNIQNLQNKMLILTQQNKRKYENEIKQLTNQKNKEIEDLKSRLQNLKKQKKAIQIKNQSDLKDLQNKNLKAVEQLETLYQRKLSFENQKYFQLQQQLIQLKLKQKKQIENLQNIHNTNLTLLKAQFSENFNKTEKVYKATKQSSDQLQKIFDQRVNQIEQQHEEEIKQLNDKKKKYQQQVKKTIAELTTKLEAMKRDFKDANQDRNRYKTQNIELLSIKSSLEKQLQNAKQKIEEKSNQINEKEDIMKNKDRKIGEFQIKVNDLQKKKHVLSYKATQMRKSMEPKQAQIQKLKQQLFKLQQEFEGVLQEQQKNLLNMQRVEKQKQVLSKSLKDQIILTKQKESFINKISMDILNCMEKKEIDPKFYYKQMVNLYHKYVQKMQQKHITHDPKGIQQMGRQIVHLEKSIFQVNKSSEKILARRTDQISKKTKENAQLIFDLNEIRKKNKQQAYQLKNKQKQIQTLERQKNSLLQDLKKNIESGKQYNTYQDPNASSNQKILGTPTTNLIRSSSLKASIRKGKVIKGPNYDVQTLATFDKAKLSQLIGQVQILNQRNQQIEVLVKGIRNKISKHLQIHKCIDIELEEEVQELSEIK